MQVENLNYEIDWGQFKKGSSFFIPCLDPQAARTEIAPVLKRLKLKTHSKECIEQGVRGLRVWRA